MILDFSQPDAAGEILTFPEWAQQDTPRQAPIIEQHVIRGSASSSSIGATGTADEPN